MIDKEKQIEEMADTMCGSHSDYCARDGFPCEQGCRNGYLRAARRMYDAGYRKQSGWISVDERLPEMHEDVLCLYGRSVEISFMCSDGTWCGIHNRPITHWMPIPEPPKTKGGEST